MEGEIVKKMCESPLFYVYMLRCDDRSIYTGITNDVRRRFEEHSTQGKEAAKYTKSHRAVKIEAVFSAPSRSSAASLEYAIKHLKKQEKERLIVEPEILQSLLPDKLSGCDFHPVIVEWEKGKDRT